jgi:hypothetical protein
VWVFFFPFCSSTFGWHCSVIGRPGTPGVLINGAGWYWNCDPSGRNQVVWDGPIPEDMIIQMAGELKHQEDDRGKEAKARKRPRQIAPKPRAKQAKPRAAPRVLAVMAKASPRMSLAQPSSRKGSSPVRRGRMSQP